VTLKKLLKWIGLGSLGLVGAIIASVVGFWLYLAEPWYDGTIATRMTGGPYAAPWRDDTWRIADIFPAGMSAAEALALLRRNGFSCNVRNSTTDQDGQLSCARTLKQLICLSRLKIDISLNAANTIADRTANSYSACLRTRA